MTSWLEMTIWKITKRLVVNINLFIYYYDITVIVIIILLSPKCLCVTCKCYHKLIWMFDKRRVPYYL